MSFSTFCNICFIKENIIKLSEEEPILNILISFTSCPELVNDNIYLCTNCFKKLEEYDKFRELYLTNFVRFRYLYNDHKKQLEIRNEPAIETQLKAFVDINVERPKGSPLIENFEDTQTCRNNTASHIHTTCVELDHEFIKISLDELLNKNSLKHVDTSFSPKNSTLKNETQNYETDSFNEDPEKDNGSSNIKNNTEIYIKCEPLLFDEGYNELTNTDTVATSISCFSTTSNKNWNVPIDQNSSQIEDTYLEKDGPNPESHDEFVSDTNNDDNDISDSWTNTENYTSDDTTAEEGSTDNENKTTTSDSDDKYKCDKCNKIFTDTAKLKKHKRLHSDKRPYKCDECDLGFTRRDHLTRHKRIHSGETPFSCDECNKTFRDACNLMRHKRIHDAERPYKCDKCGIGFTECYILNRHKRKYHGEKPYSCDECNQKFTNSSTLKNHKRTHNGDRPHKCAECGSAFKQLCHLKAHLRIHTGERPYNCDECGKKFMDNSKLINHKRIHSGEKPFKCDECDLRFTERSSLNKHKLVHTGKRPYACTECKKTFSNSSNLRKHMRLHSDE